MLSCNGRNSIKIAPIGKSRRKDRTEESTVFSAVKYWYDPQNPEQIGLATPVKNLLTQFIRNYYGENRIL